MKSSESTPLTIKILGREYSVACPADERDHLIKSAHYLDDRMVAIRKRAAGLGVERIAIMAGLNMARELLDREEAEKAEKKPRLVKQASAGPAAESDEEQERANQLHLRIDAALDGD